jgi:antitoxin FitA
MLLNQKREAKVANLIVRGVDESVVRALKEQAGLHGCSAEAEHRAILLAALVRPKKKTFAQVLAAMPNVGVDDDFVRLSTNDKAKVVFD